ncbi:MAG: RNA polymerase sigma factor [Defluviitaleaceae bacterium]|nr:RNA polymerase sigma factor [Defluviitaleaceae bacterium]
MEDSLIVDMFFKRQEAALFKAQEKYGKRIYTTAKNILLSDEDAKECANDTLLKAWDAIPPNRPSFLGAFLSKIARNLAINRWRAKNTQKRGSGEVDLLLSELTDCIPHLDSPDKAYESSLVVESINICLGGMEQTARAVFVRRYFYGESIYSISKRFQIGESNVKSKLFRARKLLKEQLEKEGVVL